MLVARRTMSITSFVAPIAERACRNPNCRSFNPPFSSTSHLSLCSSMDSRILPKTPKEGYRPVRLRVSFGASPRLRDQGQSTHLHLGGKCAVRESTVRNLQVQVPSAANRRLCDLRLPSGSGAFPFFILRTDQSNSSDVNGLAPSAVATLPPTSSLTAGKSFRATAICYSSLVRPCLLRLVIWTTIR